MPRIFALCTVTALMFSAGHLPASAQDKGAGAGVSSVKGKRLEVSPNGRYFVDQNGKPFFYLGDTCWLLFQRLDRGEIDEYLKDRAAKGFTVIQAYVLRGLGDGKNSDSNNGRNGEGETALIDRDPTRLNEAFFKNVDYIVNRANELGLVMGLVTSKSWHVNKHPERVFNPTNAYAFGKLLAERYRNNAVIWFVGGDSPPGEDEATWVAMARGHKDGSNGRQLVCYHGSGSTSSSTWFHKAGWLDFNSIQSGHHFGSDSYAFVSKDRALEPAKPIVDMEPAYENHHTGAGKPRIDAHKVRTQAYSAMLAGAAGHGYGALDLFHLYKDADGPFPKDGFQHWRKALAYPASRHMGLMRRLFEQRPWYRMVPDQSVLSSEPGSGPLRLVSARAEDRSFAIAYTPRGGPLAIHMDKLAGAKVKARWYDPRDGSWREIGEFARSGVHEFTPPTHGAKDDWVLVLDDAARNDPVAVPKSAAAGQGIRAAPETIGLVRVAAAQAKRRSIDWRLKKPGQVLEAVDKNLAELEQIVHRAGERKCDALALPEDTLGLLDWFGVNEQVAKEVLPEAGKRMLERLGRAAAEHRMYLVVCSDHIETDGGVYNTAFFLGRDGKEMGRYHKVCPTWFESGARQRGRSFPVFPTPDLGTVGLTICYDLVMPETARCLALEGADILFFPTMGTAAVGDDDIGMQALRVRAAENQVWLVVAHRGGGAMIISPRGKIVAQADGPDGLAIADIDPYGDREGGDSANYQKDMRARLFRERNPEAFGILTSINPPALAKLPIDITREEGARIMARMLTVGEEEFREAAGLARAGKTTEAIAAFEKLRAEYKGTWIDRVATERLETLRRSVPEGHGGKNAPQAAKSSPEGPGVHGLAAKYPGDTGIANDPRVVFTENFESTIDDMKKKWSSVDGAQIMSHSDDRPAASGGKRSLLIAHVGGKGTGGSLYRSLKPGHDKLFARFYVKFDPDCVPIHHFGTNMGGYYPPTPWPQGGAGLRPGGDKAFTVGVEPFGDRWAWDYYTYWCEMRGSPPKGQTWGNSFIRDPGLKVERGKWICVELMMKMNDVSESNGEMALWIDGKPVSRVGKGFPKGRWEFDKFIPGEGGEGIRWSDMKGGPEYFKVPEGGLPFEGFRWRTTKQISLNYLWVYLYITKAPAGHTSRIWFDDIVVATDYIGPIEERTKR